MSGMNLIHKRSASVLFTILVFTLLIALIYQYGVGENEKIHLSFSRTIVVITYGKTSGLGD
jgi:hypothetical protein